MCVRVLISNPISVFDSHRSDSRLGCGRAIFRAISYISPLGSVGSGFGSLFWGLLLHVASLSLANLLPLVHVSSASSTNPKSNSSSDSAFRLHSSPSSLVCRDVVSQA